MMKSELTQKLAESHSLLNLWDASAVTVVLDAIADALACGDRMEIRGFDSLSLNYRTPCVGRNPKTGVKVEVAGKFVPHFKTSKELRERIDAANSQGALARPETNRRVA